MGISFAHPWALLALPPALVLLLLIGRTTRRLAAAGARKPAPAVWREQLDAAGARWRTLRQRPIATAVRILLIISLVLSLAGTGFTHSAPHEAVIYVADLSASTFPARADMEQFIRDGLKVKNAEDMAGVLAVGQDAVIDVPVSNAPRFEKFSAQVRPDHTDLERGLRLAAALLPQGYRQRLVLISDGRENMGSAMDEVRRLRQQGATVDVMSIAAPKGAEALIRGLEAPTATRQGERLVLTVTVSSTVAANQGILRLYDDRTLVEQRPLTLPSGEQTVTFAIEKPTAGFHNYKVTLEAAQDTLPQNNEASALVEVLGPPRVLLVEGTAGAATNVAAALKAAGVQSDINSADAMPEKLTSLEKYGAVVMVDVPAPFISSESMKALQLYVREAGRGLVTVGGQNAYGMGAYARTPLEELLPLNMDIPQKKEKPSAAVVLIIENLESQQKVNISKEAGKGVVGLLTQRDFVGISDANLGMVVPLRRVGDKDAVMKAIDGMQPGDPPSYIPYLRQAAEQLKDAQAKVKHIILLGDGDAQVNNFAEYEAVVKQIAQMGITISTIETNSMQPSEFFLMEQIANWGGGRFYRGDDAAAIPQIFLKEAQLASRPGIVEDHFLPAIVTPSPILQNITSFPTLDGYVATTPKPAAEVVLTSAQNDPVLAQWQTGLGKVVAWTSDSQGLWTRDMVSWSGFAHFWSNVISYVLPAPGQQSLQTRVTMHGGIAHLAVEQATATGEGGAVEGLPALNLTVIQPDGSIAQSTLPATAPGQFEGDIGVGKVGSYLVRFSTGGQQNAVLGTAGIVVPYSPEFELAGTDSAFLAGVAKAGGGHVLTAPEAAFARDLPPASGTIPLDRSLLLLALLLWPLDVAARRLSTTPRELKEAVAAWRRRRSGAASTEVTAAFQKVKERRTARPAAPAATVAQAPRPVRVQPPASQAPAAAAKPPAPPPAPKQEQPADDGSLAARLLKAKARK